MSPIILLFCTTLSSFVSASPQSVLLQAHPNRLDDIRLFQDMMKNYDRQYADEAEILMRFEIFASNLKKIEQWNRGAEGQTTFGVTLFSDRTEAEKELMLGYKPITESLPMAPLPEIASANNDANWDWRESGVVTPVKNQGNDCGSCWAFTSTAVIESANAIAGGGLLTLSEQQLVDCVKFGCKNGSPAWAMKYAQEHGLPTEKDYPYYAKDGQCKNWTTIAARVSKYYMVARNETEMKNAVRSVGPISVGMAASSAFHHYTGGIISDTNCPDLNHAVTIVGYGNEGGVDYWLVKNSWGTGWGENGYGRVRRGINWCNITFQPIAGVV